MSVTEKELEMLAKHLKHLRNLSSLTQDELANRVGVTRQVIVSIETGKKLPSKSLFLAILGMFTFISVTAPLLRVILETTKLNSVLSSIWRSTNKTKEEEK